MDRDQKGAFPAIRTTEQLYNWEAGFPTLLNEGTTSWPKRIVRAVQLMVEGKRQEAIRSMISRDVMPRFQCGVQITCLYRRYGNRCFHNPGSVTSRVYHREINQFNASNCIPNNDISDDV